MQTIDHSGKVTFLRMNSMRTMIKKKDGKLLSNPFPRRGMQVDYRLRSLNRYHLNAPHH